MKLLKIIGLFCLFTFTFFYTEKVINVTTEQDEIMQQIKEYAEKVNESPTNATINNDTITPGIIGHEVNTESSYKAMKKIGYFSESLIKYQDTYPEVSIYNNLSKYIIKGSTQNKAISLIYILTNDKTLDNILSITNKYNLKVNLFIDSTYLNNNIEILNKLKDNEVYNYGLNGTYTKDNLIIGNNIINNKSNNKATYCLFTKKDTTSLSYCANLKMLSIIPSITGSYQDIKTNLTPGDIILFNNTQELSNIIEYITSKGYQIIPLSELITE